MSRNSGHTCILRDSLVAAGKEGKNDVVPEFEEGGTGRDFRLSDGEAPFAGVQEAERCNFTVAETGTDRAGQKGALYFWARSTKARDLSGNFGEFDLQPIVRVVRICVVEVWADSGKSVRGDERLFASIENV